jgi:hypothetical protein
MHCWALGRNYGAMPIEDAAFFPDELSSFCSERGLDYTTYPMHEVTAHPSAPDMIRLFAPHLGQAYDPILTPGTPLASRPDWAAWVRRARDGSWPETGYWTSPRYQLVCRSNLDLHTGTTGIYRRRHGAQAVLERALADGPISQEQLYFPGLAPPAADLAARAGDADSTTIYFDAASVRYRWLDRQRRA